MSIEHGGDRDARRDEHVESGSAAEHADPTMLSLDELRERRRSLQAEDDAVSYTRRVAQARLDLVIAEAERRVGEGRGRDQPEGDDHSGSQPPAHERLRAILARKLTGGDARPPRPAEDLSDHPVAVELDRLCRDHGFGRMDGLDDDELVALRDRIAEFEARISADRQVRHARLDALSAELVARYRDGRADVDAILSD